MVQGPGARAAASSRTGAHDHGFGSTLDHDHCFGSTPDHDQCIGARDRHIGINSAASRSHSAAIHGDSAAFDRSRYDGSTGGPGRERACSTCAW